MTAAPLTLPGAGDRAWRVPAGASFVCPDRLPDGTSAANLSRYGDPTWDLSPLSRRQHEPARRISWDLFPVALRASFKRARWDRIPGLDPGPVLSCRQVLPPPPGPAAEPTPAPRPVAPRTPAT